MTILLIIFFLAFGCVIHTYVLYPFILDRLSFEKPSYVQPLRLPTVDIIIAAYNEESVIGEKIQSILDSDYPSKSIRIIIGSDGSNDGTESIVSNIQHPEIDIVLKRFERSGKTAVVDGLMAMTESPIVIFTDANVMFTSSTIRALVLPFSNSEVGLVGADIRPRGEVDEGIAHQESQYLQRENRMKYIEGAAWGTMMGAFGGCYAMRRPLFVPVPEHFLVDDFHITMSVLKQGSKAILAPNAVCFEDVSTKLSEEYRRKVRMSTGNFQNLRVFAPMLFQGRKGLAFAFLSHKVMRWLTPLFILAMLGSALALMQEYFVFQWVFYGLLILCLTPFIDQTLRSLGLTSRLLRFVTYFISMNLALLVGMLKSFRKVERAIWQPTERNQ